LSGLLEKMQALANNFEFGDGKAAFDEAYGYFDSIGSQPSRALELLLSGLVRVLEGVALFTLDFARGVVLSLFDLIEAVIRLVREAMFARWEIPVVSQLYALFTGRSLRVTPVEVIGWTVAIPFTILSKVVVGRAPFPDDEALDEFRKTFTVDMLRSRIGIDGPTEAQTVAAWDPRWKENFLIGYSCTMFVRALGEPGQVVGNATGQSLGEAAIVPLVLRFMSTGFTAPWALSAAAGAPSCTPGEPGFGVTIWMCQLICGPTRGLLVFKQKLIEGKPKLYLGELTLTLWGCANFAMSTWNFVAGPKTTASKLAFARGLTAILPGQTLRFLSLPELNEPAEFIPVGVLAILIPVGYFGSIGAAIADIKTSGAVTAEVAA
ncbi:MAG TPA: hypothetical protein VHW26_01645, partial [Solirubrobacteraceae bacterium]|nr:hypothetical protein [Solirubrobacteraceae bacterium]